MEKPLRLALLTPDFPTWDGGVAAVAEHLADFLQRAGNRVTVLAPRQLPGDAAFDAERDYRVRRLANVKDRYWKYLLSGWHVRSVFREQPFDAALATVWFPFAPLAVRWAPSVPLFLFVYGNDFLEPRWQKPFWRARMVRALERSRLLLAGSEGSAEALRAFWPAGASKTRVLTPGVDPDRFPVGASPREVPGPVLLTLARLVERKGQDMVLRALPRILAEFPRAEYWIAGRGADESRLRALAAELGLGDRVRFLGFVDNAQRVRLYQQCDVYLMPSRTIGDKGDFEAFGITYLEANACGKPVIGGRAGGIADAVVDGVTGFLVDPLSPAEIAEKTLRLLRDPGLARRIGGQGRARTEGEMHWRSIVKRLVALISSPPV